MAKRLAKSGTYKNPLTKLTREHIKTIYDGGDVLVTYSKHNEMYVCCHVCKQAWWAGSENVIADDLKEHVKLGQGPLVKGMHFLEVDSVYYLIPGHHVTCVNLFNLNPLGYTYGG